MSCELVTRSLSLMPDVDPEVRAWPGRRHSWPVLGVDHRQRDCEFDDVAAREGAGRHGPVGIGESGALCELVADRVGRELEAFGVAGAVGRDEVVGHPVAVEEQLDLVVEDRVGVVVVDEVVADPESEVKSDVSEYAVNIS